MSFDIAPLLPSQADAVSNLIASVIRPLEYYNQRAREEEIAKYSSEGLLALAAEDTAAVLVASAENDVVGFCISRYDDGLIWLSWFGVKDSFRKAGVGRKLLESLERTVPLRNAHKIWCDTRTSNVASQRVLEKAGFKTVATFSNHWYGQDFLIWEKTIC
jgi:ribosomal protein S18 acetylase RimI-like enzyme